MSRTRFSNIDGGTKLAHHPIRSMAAAVAFPELVEVDFAVVTLLVLAVRGYVLITTSSRGDYISKWGKIMCRQMKLNDL